MSLQVMSGGAGEPRVGNSDAQPGRGAGWGVFVLAGKKLGPGRLSPMGESSSEAM